MPLCVLPLYPFDMYKVSRIQHWQEYIRRRELIEKQNPDVTCDWRGTSFTFFFVPVDVICYQLSSSSTVRTVTHGCAAALWSHQTRGTRRNEVGLSIYPFKCQKDLKGCIWVVEVIEEVHSGEEIGSGRKENNKTEKKQSLKGCCHRMEGTKNAEGLTCLGFRPFFL